ncbi:hypothetical protein NSA47_01770 [Irregularibacter muris]|uniref:Uncharacterized protein n=1 Tax=Irregularibacter muris TaxID=1796619 RepID=A0AAE3HD50_9FIRM|nr:hypothetical protein [Irregularibacter muris]MCR1897716.1 hypothetical protein [Irregularibacter muris]
MNGLKNMLLGMAVLLVYSLAKIGLEMDAIVIIGLMLILFGYFQEYFTKGDKK